MQAEIWGAMVWIFQNPTFVLTLDFTGTNCMNARAMTRRRRASSRVDDRQESGDSGSFSFKRWFREGREAYAGNDLGKRHESCVDFMGFPRNSSAICGGVSDGRLRAGARMKSDGPSREGLESREVV